jgi:hypothetical protein
MNMQDFGQHGKYRLPLDKTRFVDIGRGRDGKGKWGNPFIIGPDGSRAEVIAAHEAWFMQSDLLAEVDTLRGMDLVCWCAPRACHGDLLLRLANA